MNERIKKLRKALDLTQREFGERIGVKPNTIAPYEIGRNQPIDAVVSLICREFDVNETWLRTGKGEMFKKVPNTALEALSVDFHLDPFDKALVEEYLNLEPTLRETFRTFFYNVLKKSIGDSTLEELSKADTEYPTLEETATYTEEANKSAIRGRFVKVKQESEAAEEIAPSLTRMKQEARAEADAVGDQAYGEILQEKRQAAKFSASQNDTGNTDKKAI